MLYNIWAGLMVLAVILMFVESPLGMAAFVALYCGVMWVLDSGKRKVERERKRPLG